LGRCKDHAHPRLLPQNASQRGTYIARGHLSKART
jgi:hypothetical protein